MPTGRSLRRSSGAVFARRPIASAAGQDRSAPARRPCPAPRRPSRSVVITGAGLGLPGAASASSTTTTSAGILARRAAHRRHPGALPPARCPTSTSRGSSRATTAARASRRSTDPADVIKLAARGPEPSTSPHEFGVPADRVRGARRRRPSSPSPPASTRCATPASRSSCATRRTTHGHAACPTAGCCPSRCATRPASSSPRRSPGYDALRRRDGRATTPTTRAASSCADLRPPRPRSTDGPRPTCWREIDRRIARARAPARSATPYALRPALPASASCRWATRSSPSTSARAGPNTQVNAPAPAATQALALAEDWIRAGRCRRVVIVGADDVTSDRLLEWIGAGFLASGAAATDEVVEEAALPFDRRRHGMILGMGATALVVEAADAARERGLRADRRGARHRDRQQRLPRHPARRRAHRAGDGAAGRRRRAALRARPARSIARELRLRLARDLHAGARRQRRGRGGRAAPGLRRRRRADRRRQHQGLHRPPDGRRPSRTWSRSRCSRPASCRRSRTSARSIPTSGRLNLSRGGLYPVRYALRLGAGFGSQITMTLLRWVPPPDGRAPRARRRSGTTTASPTARAGTPGSRA